MRYPSHRSNKNMLGVKKSTRTFIYNTQSNSNLKLCNKPYECFQTYPKT